MDVKTLEKCNKMVSRIEYLRKRKDRVDFYLNNELNNKTTLAGFGTTSSKNMCNDSIIDDEIFPVLEILALYGGKLEKEINRLEIELERL